jgi:hypothetical protein
MGNKGIYTELLRKDEWAVTKQESGCDTSHFLDHYCPRGDDIYFPHRMAWFIHDSGTPMCYYCHTRVPDEMQALLMLLLSNIEEIP